MSILSRLSDLARTEYFATGQCYRDDRGRIWYMKSRQGRRAEFVSGGQVVPAAIRLSWRSPSEVARCWPAGDRPFRLYASAPAPLRLLPAVGLAVVLAIDPVTSAPAGGLTTATVPAIIPHSFVIPAEAARTVRLVSMTPEAILGTVAVGGLLCITKILFCKDKHRPAHHDAPPPPAATVPVPGAAILLGSGIAAIGGAAVIRRRRRGRNDG
ncbi:MAG: PEP-CTERM sorting domain-containing protein [Paracoccus sp. (in: a-proteobacteria)]|nr:PEP-CTERM sorting domain-containing protein [Paracoccus sp. (in: a-proteobacteria)]